MTILFIVLFWMLAILYILFSGMDRGSDAAASAHAIAASIMVVSGFASLIYLLNYAMTVGAS